MKLLIVDDEDLTRNGLLQLLNWEDIGITEIYLADDGMKGLTSALQYQPDIVLCDVRMPRMNGIIMLEHLIAKLPDTAAIFMSGYSDKEYLKAAIKLKAIHYIEKPIDPKELQGAIQNAIEQCQQKERQKTAETLHTNLAAEQFAFQLTLPYLSCKKSIDDFSAEFRKKYGADKFKYITTFIVKLKQPQDDSTSLSLIHQSLRDYLLPMHLHVIYSEKRMYHVVYHIYGSIRPTYGTLSAIAEKLLAFFLPFGNRYIAVGETADGISNAFHSYESAVILLESSFFFETDSILLFHTPKQNNKENSALLNSVFTEFEKGIAEKDTFTSMNSLNMLYDICYHSFTLMQSQIKTLYYDLLSVIRNNRRAQKLALDLTLEDHGNTMETIDSCFSFLKLHKTLCTKTEAYFYDIEHYVPENAIIHLIKDYVSSHYMEPSLSVKAISEHAHLSVSYVCTFFKNETGTTLNQYITEFRMEKAKQLLTDPRYRIADISSSAGYSDGNYFGKSFKKFTGFSPSEYREKVLG